MWSSIFQFCAWVMSRAWRYGYSKAKKVAAWAKANASTVWNWINRGIAFGTIVEWILRILGLS